ncbi:hypothetical protein [Streptomyces sp. NBC_00648]|uniref:hypothetical protein n=1 Tax=Streptomyces sp. NBC_00648 TaxID=2975797 RepID=UPI00325447B0
MPQPQQAVAFPVRAASEGAAEDLRQVRTVRPTHKAQGSMIHCYIIWRKKYAADKRLKALVKTANAA